MKEATELTVAESEYDIIPEGTTLTVTRDHTNQFGGRRVLTVEWDNDEVSVPNRDASPSCQLYKNPEDSVWTEIHVGLDREHEKLTFE